MLDHPALEPSSILSWLCYYWKDWHKLLHFYCWHWDRICSRSTGCPWAWDSLALGCKVLACVSVPSEFISVLTSCSVWFPLMTILITHPVWSWWASVTRMRSVPFGLIRSYVRVCACMRVVSLCVHACVCEQQSQMIKSQCQKLLAKFKQLETSLKSSDAPILPVLW